LTDLSQAWANIFFEYLDKNNANQVSYVLQLEREIVLLKDDIDQCESALVLIGQMIEFLSPDMYVIAPVLRKGGYDFPINTDKPEEITSNIDRIRNMLAGKKFKLQGKERELLEHKATQLDNTIKEDYFKKWLAVLSRFRNMMIIRSNEVTVDDFIYILNDYLEYTRVNNKEMEYGETR